MRSFLKYRSATFTLLILLLSVYFLATCISNQEKKTVNVDSTGYADFAGAASCAGCHKDIYDNHLRSAHFNSSSLASDSNILGSFNDSNNSFVFSNREKLRMEKRPSGYYQAGYVDEVERMSQRFDIVMGSGNKGQSFASWSNNRLVQLPITYFTSEKVWSNSPGYPNQIAFNRPITARCMECHSTFAATQPDQDAQQVTFIKDKMVLGITCERCHGAASEHVAFQTEHPAEPAAKFIINPKKLSRQQSLDMCALCHGGRMQPKKPAFTFTAGSSLADYFYPAAGATDGNPIDVHGNQLGLLKTSKCFIKSSTMTCITCHSPHENEQGKLATYSQKCLSCHSEKHAGAIICKMTASLGSTINTNCIDCHMPKQRSMAIAVMLQGKQFPTPAMIRTHLVKVYPDETKAVLDYFKTNHRTKSRL